MEELVFSVDSALLNEIGEKLVETVHIALIELVKNSYDADATQVTIRFVESQSGGPEIEIIDNGTGMTFQEVKRYWMRIATTSKLEQSLSNIYGRPKTGSKGIGRFSCRRLGKELKLLTIAQRNARFEKTEVFFPWLQFKPGTEVTRVVCPGKRRTISKSQTGTTLIISGATTDEWSKRGYDYFKRQLAVLVANRGQRRPGYKDDPGFNICLDVPRYEGEIKDLRDDLISAGWGTLTAHINGNSQAVCHLEAIGIGKKKIVSQTRLPHLKDITLRIGIIPERKEQMRNTSVLSMGTLRKILPEWGGVHVRYKGFRVYPYGDDDWLEIDRDRGLRKGKASSELFSFAESLHGIDPKRSLLQLLSMRNHVGNVEIEGDTKGFEMKANREGFVRSEAVDELKQFVRFAIDWATIYRDYYIRIKAKKEVDIARKGLEEIVEDRIETPKIVERALDYINDEIYRLSVSLPSSEKKRVEDTIQKATDLILKHDKSNKRELHHLRLIASTATLLLVFSHEVKSLLGILESNSSLLKAIERSLPSKEASEVQNIRDNLQFSKTRFTQLLQMTSIIGFSKEDSKPGRFALSQRIKTAEDCFKLIIHSYDIDLQYEDYVAPNIMVGSTQEAELYVILLNVLSNSIKSVIASGHKKKIRISARRKNGKTYITVRDTGIGLDEENYDDVFVPFLADPDGRLYSSLSKKLNPEDKFIVGTGTGLGLGIVKEIVESYGGKIGFKRPKGKWNSKLEIILP